MNNKTELSVIKAAIIRQEMVDIHSTALIVNIQYNDENKQIKLSMVKTTQEQTHFDCITISLKKFQRVLIVLKSVNRVNTYLSILSNKPFIEQF